MNTKEKSKMTRGNHPNSLANLKSGQGRPVLKEKEKNNILLTLRVKKGEASLIKAFLKKEKKTFGRFARELILNFIKNHSLL